MGEPQGSHDPDGVVFTVLSGIEREYIRDRTWRATSRPAPAAGPSAAPHAILAVALHLRGQDLSLRDIAAPLVIATGKKASIRPRRP